MRNIVKCLLGLLAAVSVAQAQQPGNSALTAASLKRDLRRIAAYEYYYTPDLDIVGLSDKMARQLVAYLKAHDVSAAAAKNLGLGYEASPDSARLKVFSYSYSSGGTRGTITRSVLQWRNRAGQRFAYAAHDEGSIWKIHKLPGTGRTQYLLLGSEPGSGICVRGLAWLVELKGDYLLLDKQAFDKKPLIDICNVELTYDARRRTLAVTADSRALGEPDVYADKPFVPFTLHLEQGRFIRKK